MGNPLLPEIANIYKEHSEKLAITSARVKPDTWIRYMDDTFMVWSGGMEELEAFLTHHYSLRPSIQFTMELEEDGCLP